MQLTHLWGAGGSHWAAPRNQLQLWASALAKGTDKTINLIYMFLMEGKPEETHTGRGSECKLKGPAPASSGIQDLLASRLYSTNHWAALHMMRNDSEMDKSVSWTSFFGHFEDIVKLMPLCSRFWWVFVHCCVATFTYIKDLSTSSTASILWFCGAPKKSAPSSVFLSLLALFWGDFNLLWCPNQNAARDLPLSWNQLSFCKGVSFWVTHFRTYDPSTLP